MAAQSALQPVRASGRLMGFNNLFRKDMAEWWRTKIWLAHLIIWGLLINGILLGVLAAPVPDEPLPPGSPDITDPMIGGIMMYTLMTGLTTAIGIIIVMQDAIIDEKKSGTAAWVLSKPVSRTAFIVSKLLSNTISALLLMIVIQGLVAAVLVAAKGGAVNPFNWLAGMGLLALNLLFYLTLTLMLGAFYDSRGAVIGIPIAIAFGYQFVLGMLPQLMEIAPWALVNPLGEGQNSLAMLVMQGQPLPSVLPIVATAVWIVIFIIVAVWRFGKEEF